MIDDASDLVFPRSGQRKLFRQTSSPTWQVDTAVDWSALTLERLGSPIRHAMSAMYTDVVFSEALGVSLLERIVERAPETYLRAFARAQIADEHRHVNFFSRLVGALGAPQSVSPALLELERELAPIRDHEELMVHLQIIELSAQAVFIANTRRSLRALERAVRLPATDGVRGLLQAIVDNVGRDETRHVAFGMSYLCERLRAASPDCRRGLAQRAACSAALMQRAFAERSSVFMRLGLPSDALQRSFLRLEHQLGAIGLQTQVAALEGPRG